MHKLRRILFCPEVYKHYEVYKENLYYDTTPFITFIFYITFKDIFLASILIHFVLHKKNLVSRQWTLDNMGNDKSL